MRPVDAIDDQLGLIRMHESEWGIHCMSNFIAASREVDNDEFDDAQMFPREIDGETFAFVEAARLNRATTYFVENDMISIAKIASWDMPMQSLESSDLPSEFGFVVLETPVLGRDVRDRDIALSAMSWGPTTFFDPDGNQTDRTGISVVFYSDLNDFRDSQSEHLVDFYRWATSNGKPMSRHAIYHFASLEFGRDMSEYTYIDTRRGTSDHVPDEFNSRETNTVDPHLWFYAFLIISQDRIAETVRQRLARPQARRMKRGRVEPPEDCSISVVKLRRLKHVTDGDTEHSPVNWTHRWVVEGHWTHQWYPSLQDHRLIYIAPYIKGPEHLPLVIKDRVYAWVR